MSQNHFTMLLSNVRVPDPVVLLPLPDPSLFDDSLPICMPKVYASARHF